MLKKLTFVSMVSAGCSAHGEPDLQESAATQPITGGALVTKNDAPYSSVVQIYDNQALCSGIKIASNRFLTAAHCMDSWGADPGPTGQVWRSIQITNALDEAAPNVWVRASARRIYRHPSWVPGKNDSYDIGLFETNGDQTPAIPALANALYNFHVGDGTAGTLVGYGCNTFDTSMVGHKQFAGFTSVSAATYGTSANIYAHDILARESGSGRQGACSGDSGGPLFGSLSGTTQVMAVQRAANGSGDPLLTRFTRIANVSRWLAAPHNFGLTTFSGTGFLQQPVGTCALVSSSSAGTGTKLGDCEGYDTAIHGQLWTMQAVGAYVQIRTAKSGSNRCITDDSGVARIQDCSSTRQDQQWSVIALTADSSGSRWYHLRNRSTNRYLSNGNNTYYAPLGVSASPNPPTDGRWKFYR